MIDKSLKETQRLFLELISAPEGVEDGLKHHPNLKIEDWFRGDEKLTPIRRLNIYANMYFWRIHDAIREDFPALFKVIGKENFNNLMVDYLLKHPSRSPLLQYVSKALPAFLEGYPLTKERPFLPDLARLEWERSIIFEAPNVSYLTLQDLKKIPPEKWAAMKIKFITALTLLRLDWEVDQTWVQAEKNQKITNPKRKETFLRIWRHDFKVYHQPLSLEEKTSIELLQEGKTFAEMCEGLGQAEKAAQFLTDWVESGLISHF